MGKKGGKETGVDLLSNVSEMEGSLSPLLFQFDWHVYVD